jgi:lipoprotein-anchoring transpeptidase ErfK/SrfK
VSTSATATPVSLPVHVSSLQSDGGVYGVGMPIVAYFNRKVTDTSIFNQAATVTVNGAPAAGAWYWQRSGRDGQVLEAHYRLRDYWPARAKIDVFMPVQGLPAGRGLAYENNLTLAIATGAANITTVDGNSKTMVVTSDGRTVMTLPVSLGKATTPTFSGVKVVMEKDRVERMIGTDPADPYDLQVPWSVRLTNSGEFVHAASWNGGNIGVRSTSNGCTNLTVTDAEKYFNFAQIGDVFTYTNTGGQAMPIWDGYGDWNVPWSTWLTGGAV